MCILSSLGILLAAGAVISTLSLMLLFRLSNGDSHVTGGFALVVMGLPTAIFWEAIRKGAPRPISRAAERLITGEVRA